MAEIPNHREQRVAADAHRGPHARQTANRPALTTRVAALGIWLAIVTSMAGLASSGRSSDQAASRDAPNRSTNDVVTASTSDEMATLGGRPTPRVREGTRLADQLGTFQSRDSRLAFTPEGSTSQFIVLENLLLDRVVREVSEAVETLVWRVSGRVTEYRGANYIFLDRAVVKRRAPIQGAAGEPLTP